MRFKTSGASIDVDIDHLIIAGWTGRDIGAVEHHIGELAEIGVKPPSEVPLFYRISSTLLVQGSAIEVLGNATSGEVEPLLIDHGGILWLGLGSDQTDRELEAVSVAASKQACPKPVSDELWRFDEVEAHLDDLILRCHIQESGGWVLYQEGPLERIRPLRGLVGQSGLGANGAMLCGTLSAIGPVRPAGAYRMELLDSLLNRSLYLDYRVSALPVIQ